MICIMFTIYVNGSIASEVKQEGRKRNMKKRVIDRLFAVLLASAMTLGVQMPAAFAKEADTQPAATAVDSLTLQPGSTTASVNLNWYAPQGTGNGEALVKFDGKIVKADVRALHTPTVLDESKYKDKGQLSCKAAVSGLKAGSEYKYSISNDGGRTWSGEHTYKTPDKDNFTFAFVSDPQIKENKAHDDRGWNASDKTNQTGWAKMMETIGKTGTSLVVSAGDQVEDQKWGKTSEYNAFFAPEEMSSIAYAPAVGNHDRHYMFDDHFNLPNEENDLTEVKTTFRGQNNGSSSSHGNYIKATADEVKINSVVDGAERNAEGYYDYPERREMETKANYYYLYNNILFITLNTGAYPGGNDEESGTESGKAENEAVGFVKNFRNTIDDAKKAYDGQYKWIVVTHHKSTETVAKHTADSDVENYVDAGFEKLMADEDVDFVLGGHDHVYSRSYVLDGSGNRASERLDTINDPDGVIYITGNCSSDMQYYTPFEKLDKDNNKDYPRLANGRSGSQAYLEGKGKSPAEQAAYLPIGCQERNQEYSPACVMFNVRGNTISARAYNLDGDSENPSSKEIDSFTVTKGSDGGEKAAGFNNGKSSLDMSQAGRYDSGQTDKDGGVMEIVDYNDENGWSYTVNGKKGVLTAVPFNAEKSKLRAGDKVDLLDGYDIDVKSLVTAEGFEYGDMTSVAVSPDGKTLATAVQAEGYNDPGRAVIFNCNKDGSLTFQRTVETGVQPDMITFTPDGTRILTANEGEPRKGYADGVADPAGSVTIIDVNTMTPSNVGFTAYDSDAARAALVKKGVVLKKNTNPSVDLEPEYIAASSDTAYVTLQEANAVAVIDLAKKNVTDIDSVGFEDYSKVKVDLNKGDKKYKPDNYDNLKGIRMPDGIALTSIDGTDYLLTANEGDSREWGKYNNENKSKMSPDGKKFDKNVTWFDSKDYDGLDSRVDYVFGGRSFTMLKVTDEGLEEVFDSGSDFEAKTAEYLPEYFNTSNDELETEDRSGKKGPEPETVTVGRVGDKTYAFVTMERIGGVIAYDVTDPEKVSFVNYINSRDFSDKIGADDSPEGLKFVEASKSPTGNALLLAACEVGGTLAAYELEPANRYVPPVTIPDSRHDVTVTAPDNGSVTADKKSAEENETVTLTVKPSDGYEIDKLTVKSGDKEVEVKAGENGTYTFKMPSSEVTVDVTFRKSEETKPEPEPDPDENCPSKKFSDLDTGLWYHEAVDYVLRNNFFDGEGQGMFAPDGTMTRAMFVKVLANVEGIDESQYTGSDFTDVESGQWYAPAVGWAARNGIASGVGNNKFDPEGSVTREQMAAFMYRYANYRKVDTRADRTQFDAFTDKGDVDDWAEDSMVWATDKDIINGMTEKTLKPLDNSTRAQVAQIIMQYDRNINR